jgi:hypothetical protein
MRRIVQMRSHIADQGLDAGIGIRAFAGLQRWRRTKIHRCAGVPHRQHDGAAHQQQRRERRARGLPGRHAP